MKRRSESVADAVKRCRTGLIDDVCAERDRLRRDNARLRKWMRYMRSRWLPLMRMDTLIGGVAAEELRKIRAALRGDAPPKGGKR